MNVSDAIAQRRSIKKFQARPVTREEIEALLDAAVLAPNHKLTQPWRFYVLGPEARRRYGLALGERKARKLPDPAAADSIREKTAAEYEAFPALIAVAMTLNESPEVREEDLRGLHAGDREHHADRVGPRARNAHAHRCGDGGSRGARRGGRAGW
jgi:nitroreductase